MASCGKLFSVKEVILRALRQGGPVSGEALAKKAGISRTAVWKHILGLRRKGYQIESFPGAGYRLRSTSDVLLPEDIEVGGRWRVVFHREVGSTQEIARGLIRQGASEGTLVLAERQSEGKGRMGRSWASPPGGVWLSLILKPRFKPPETLRLPLLTGLAVAEAIRKAAGIETSLKWPNDVLLGGKKVGGVLCELDAETDRVNYVILGIGVNVNNELPEELKEMATSVKQELGRELSRAEIIRCLLIELESLYQRLEQEGFEPIREAWKERSSVLGLPVMVKSLDEVTQGEAMDIDLYGALLLRKPDGTQVKVIAGDVSLRMPQN